MFLSGRPLLDTAADTAFFVDRTDELATILAAVDAHLNVCVLGGRGSGKTSLLRRVAFHLQEARTHRVVVVDATIAPDAQSLLGLVAERIVGPDEVFIPVVNAGTPLSKYVGSYETRPSPAGRLLATVDRLRGDLSRDLASVGGDDRGPWWDPGQPAVVLVDGADAASAHVLFGQLRDELWTLPIVWVVSGDADQRAGYLKPPADAFFDTVVTLGPLAPSDARDLIRRRLEETDDVPDSVLNDLVMLTDRSPRGLVSAARAHLDALRSGDGATLDAVGRRRRAAAESLAKLGRGATMLAAELRARGGAASASDESLLNALGWSRPRATQVFKQLEDAGLVVASERREPGAGRPRKVYELTEPV